MRRLPSALLLGLIATGGAGAACSSGSTAPAHNPGDTVIVDVEASTAPPPAAITDADTDPDGIFDPVDSSSIYGSSGYDASPVLVVCAPPDGSAGAPSDSGTKASVDAGAKSPSGTGDASASTSGGLYGGADGGCQPFPAECMAQPDCTCLLGMLSSQIPCVPHCGVNLDHSGFSIYCPP